TAPRARRPAPPPAATARPRLTVHAPPLPAGAVARLGTLRFRSGGSSEGIAFLPDGKTLVTAPGYRSHVLLWDVATGRVRREVALDRFTVNGFAVSADGQRLAVTGLLKEEPDKPLRGEVRVLDLPTGKELRTWRRDRREIGYHNPAFTPDGKLLASLDQTATLRIEEVATGAEILRHQFAQDNSNVMAMSPDGSTLAVWT